LKALGGIILIILGCIYVVIGVLSSALDTFGGGSRNLEIPGEITVWAVIFSQVAIIMPQYNKHFWIKFGLQLASTAFFLILHTHLIIKFGRHYDTNETGRVFYMVGLVVLIILLSIFWVLSEQRRSKR
jgi:hypothetical protein